jgi:hypothetical protein
MNITLLPRVLSYSLKNTTLREDIVAIMAANIVLGKRKSN